MSQPVRRTSHSKIPNSKMGEIGRIRVQAQPSPRWSAALLIFFLAAAAHYDVVGCTAESGTAAAVNFVPCEEQRVGYSSFYGLYRDEITQGRAVCEGESLDELSERERIRETVVVKSLKTDNDESKTLSGDSSRRPQIRFEKPALLRKYVYVDANLVMGILVTQNGQHFQQHQVINAGLCYPSVNWFLDYLHEWELTHRNDIAGSEETSSNFETALKKRLRVAVERFLGEYERILAEYNAGRGGEAKPAKEGEEGDPLERNLMSHSVMLPMAVELRKILVASAQSSSDSDFHESVDLPYCSTSYADPSAIVAPGGDPETQRRLGIQSLDVFLSENPLIKSLLSHEGFTEILALQFKEHPSRFWPLQLAREIEIRGEINSNQGLVAEPALVQGESESESTVPLTDTQMKDAEISESVKGRIVALIEERETRLNERFIVGKDLKWRELVNVSVGGITGGNDVNGGAAEVNANGSITDNTKGADTPHALNFLIAGFARSGTTTTQYNLRAHPEVAIMDYDTTFNFPQLVRVKDTQKIRVDVNTALGQYFQIGKTKEDADGIRARPKLVGSKINFICRNFPKMKQIYLLREPIEWLQSVYNLRVHMRCYLEGGGNDENSNKGDSDGSASSTSSPSDENTFCKDNVGNDFLGVARGEKHIEDTQRHLGLYSDLIEGNVLKNGDCNEENLLVLEFEELKKDPQTLFRKISEFLGITDFADVANADKTQTKEPTNSKGGAVADAADRKNFGDEGNKGDQNPSDLTFISKNQGEKFEYRMNVQDILCVDEEERRTESGKEAQSGIETREDDSERDSRDSDPKFSPGSDTKQIMSTASQKEEVFRVLRDYYDAEYGKSRNLLLKYGGYRSESAASNGSADGISSDSSSETSPRHSIARNYNSRISDKFTLGAQRSAENCKTNRKMNIKNFKRDEEYVRGKSYAWRRLEGNQFQNEGHEAGNEEGNECAESGQSSDDSKCGVKGADQRPSKEEL